MIVESPNKTRKIREILGSGWDVAASLGHIRDLPVKDLGIEMPGYRPRYEMSDRGADVVKGLRARAAKAEAVYLATDPDREGEAIAWHLSESLKLKRPLRVTFDAITPEVVRRAVASPRAVDSRLVHAQEARRVLDRLVGYQVSPVLSRQTARRGLSAGRVQSPAVRLVVEREREIEAFREVRHFGAELSFDGNGWRAQWETGPYLKKDEKYILDEALATRAAACRSCTVLASGNRLVKQPPPPPFTTSTMLQAASVRLRWKPDVTAQVAQRLFEAGLITYHRTDSQNFSAEALEEVRGYAAERGLPVPARARSWRARGNAQEAHEAVRPTHFATEQAGDDPAQQALYRLIWLRAVASQLADAEWSVNTTRLSARNGEETFTFKAEGRILAAPGWKALTARDDAEEDDDREESGGKVPVLTMGAAVEAEKGRVLYKKTEPPTRYTQATLIKKLETIGIGRPSTYPAILKNVQARGYLEDDKKYLRPTELGYVVIDALLTRFSFAEYEFTRALEAQLDDIAEGKAEYLAVVSAADERLQTELQALGGAGRPSTRTFPAPTTYAKTRVSSKTSISTNTPVSAKPRISPQLMRFATPPAFTDPAHRAAEPERPAATPARRTAPGRVSRTAPDRAGRAFPTADTAGTETAPKKSARKKRAPAKAAAAGKRTAKTTSLPTGRRAAKAASSGSKTKRLPSKKQIEALAPPCPVCKAGFVRLPQEDAKAWSCSAYADTGCRFTVWRTIAGRTMETKDVAALCREGRTEKLRGFLSKTGRPFEAALVLNGEGRVEFSFR